MMNDWRGILGSCAVILVVATAAYLNSVQGGFTFDDRFAIVLNEDVKPSTPIENILTHDFWGQNLSSTSSHKSFRPLTTLSFRWDYSHSELNPYLYHWMNLYLNDVVSLLVFMVAMVTFPNSRPFEVPLVVALLFATHPVHAEAVASLVGRAELLCSCFAITSFLVYVCIFQFPQNQGFKRVGLFLVSMLFFYLGCASKEVGITILGVLAAYEVFRIISIGLLPNRKLTSEGVESVIRIFLLAANGVFYLLTRKYFIGEIASVGHEVFRKTENPVAFMEPGIFKALTIGWVQIYYLYLLIYPVYLSCDYSFNCIPVVESFEDPRVPIVLVVGLMFISLGLKAIYNGLVLKDYRLASGLTWMIIPFLPSSHMFVNIGTMVAERLLYIPSIGYCLLLGHFLDIFCGFLSKTILPKEAPQAPKGKKVKLEGFFDFRSFPSKFLWAITIILLAFYFPLLFSRNNDWWNDESLFVAAYKVCPNSVKVLMNRGTLFREKGKIQESLQYFERVVEIDPNFCEMDMQIGLSYATIDPYKTIELLRKALDCKFTQLEAGKALISVGEQTGAFTGKNYNPRIHFILGELFERIGSEQAIERASTHFKTSGNAYLQANDMAKAYEAFHSAYQLEKDKCEHELLIAQLLGGLERKNESFLHFKNARYCGKTFEGTAQQMYVKVVHARLEEYPNSADHQYDWAESIEKIDKNQAHDHFVIAGNLYLGERSFWEAIKAGKEALSIRKGSCTALTLITSVYALDSSVNNEEYHSYLKQIVDSSDCDQTAKQNAQAVLMNH